MLTIAKNHMSRSLDETDVRYLPNGKIFVQKAWTKQSKNLRQNLVQKAWTKQSKICLTAKTLDFEK